MKNFDRKNFRSQEEEKDFWDFVETKDLNSHQIESETKNDEKKDL